MKPNPKLTIPDWSHGDPCILTVRDLDCYIERQHFKVTINADLHGCASAPNDNNAGVEGANQNGLLRMGRTVQQKIAAQHGLQRKDRGHDTSPIGSIRRLRIQC